VPSERRYGIPIIATMMGLNVMVAPAFARS
jgi:hypothetical protein